jgi:hypothetical protein
VSCNGKSTTVPYDFSHVCPKGLTFPLKRHDCAPLCGGVLPPHCETKWWCCVYKIKTKKKKEGENPWQAVVVLPLEDECAMAFGDGLQW